MNLRDFFTRLGSSEFRPSPAIGVTFAVWFAAIIGSILMVHTIDVRRTEVEAQTRATLAQVTDVQLWGSQQDSIIKRINQSRAAIDRDCKDSQNMNASVMHLVQMLDDKRRGVVATASTLAAASPSPVAPQAAATAPAATASSSPTSAATPAPATLSYSLQVALQGRYPDIIADLDRLRSTGRPISTTSLTVIRTDQGQRASNAAIVTPGLGDPKSVTLSIPLTVYFPPADACRPAQLAQRGASQ